MGIDLSKDYSKEFLPRLASTYTAACFSVFGPILFDRSDPTAIPEVKRFHLWSPEQSTEEENRIISERIEMGNVTLNGHLAHYDNLATLAREIEEASRKGILEEFIDKVDQFKYALGYYNQRVEEHKKQKGTPSFLVYPTNPSGSGHFILGGRRKSSNTSTNPEDSFLSLEKDLLYLGLAKKDYSRKVKSIQNFIFGTEDSFDIRKNQTLRERLYLVMDSLKTAGLHI